MISKNLLQELSLGKLMLPQNIDELALGKYGELLPNSKNQIQDIYQQIYMTAVSLEINPSFVSKLKVFILERPLHIHILVARTVILSHVVDDIIDQYNNHKTHRAEIIKVVKDLFKGNSSLESDCERLLPSLIESLILNINNNRLKRVIKDEFIYLIDNIPNQYNKRIFAVSFFRLIIAGLAQSTYLWSLDTKQDYTKAIDQETIFINYYKKLTQQTLLKVDKLITLWSANSKLHSEVYISTASSLQEMFSIFTFEAIDTNIIECWNGILGPMVYLNNYIQEHKLGIKLMDNTRRHSHNSYEEFIDTNWRYIHSHVKNKSIKYPNRFMQFMLAYRLLTSNNVTHNFGNLPSKYSNLIEIYHEIYLTVLKEGIVNIRDLPTLVM